MRDLKEDNEVVWQMLGKNHRGACLKISDKWVVEANIMVQMETELIGDDRQDENEEEFEVEGKQLTANYFENNNQALVKKGGTFVPLDSL